MIHSDLWRFCALAVALAAIVAFAIVTTPPIKFIPAPLSASAKTNRLPITTHDIIAPEPDGLPFEARWSPVNEIPKTTTPFMYDEMTGDITVAPPVTVATDEPVAQAASAVAQVEPKDVEPRSKPHSVAPTPRKSGDICSKYGRKKVWYMKGNHKSWRCVVT